MAWLGWKEALASLPFSNDLPYSTDIQVKYSHELQFYPEFVANSIHVLIVYQCVPFQDA